MNKKEATSLPLLPVVSLLLVKLLIIPSMPWWVVVSPLFLVAIPLVVVAILFVIVAASAVLLLSAFAWEGLERAWSNIGWTKRKRAYAREKARA